MPNVVVDASVVASAALKRQSTPERALIFALVYDALYLSEPVIAEIRRPKFRKYVGEERLADILALILADAHFISPTERVVACRDPADDKYLELAVAAEAALIISGDRDLLSLSPWRGIRIVSPAEYVRLINASDRRSGGQEGGT
ncbi:MAG: putative toxin-antitoxin system toxin component, PIN family [Alphaproteobacteria bacterium]|nr:putative toxin-antitoxin system toxin component, PIN family [Alphaproteobacteria bacterium]